MGLNDPRVPGGLYFNGYWGLKYEVVAIDDHGIEVRWEDGRRTTHCTAWDAKHDRVLFTP